MQNKKNRGKKTRGRARRVRVPGTTRVIFTILSTTIWAANRAFEVLTKTVQRKISPSAGRQELRRGRFMGNLPESGKKKNEKGGRPNLG